MSTFAVFGMTRDFALAEARKRTPTYRFEKDKAGVNRRVELSQDEWEVAVQAKADKTMEGARIAQLSCGFDAPQFAKDFSALVRARGDCRDLEIRARVQDKHPHRAQASRRPPMVWKPMSEVGLS